MKHHETKRLPKLPSKPMKTMLSQIFRPSSRPGESNGRPGPSHRWTPPSDDQDLPRSDMATFTDFETVAAAFAELGPREAGATLLPGTGQVLSLGPGGWEAMCVWKSFGQLSGSQDVSHFISGHKTT